MPRLQSHFVQLFLFDALSQIFAFLAVHFGEHPDGIPVHGLQAQNILQRLPGVIVGKVLDVIIRQPQPVFDLLVLVLRFNFCFEGERFWISSLQT